MVEVFTVDEDGYIKLTKEELEELLQKAYEEGKNNSPTYYPVYPSYPGYYPTWLSDPPVRYTTITC